MIKLDAEVKHERFIKNWEYIARINPFLQEDDVRYIKDYNYLDLIIVLENGSIYLIDTLYPGFRSLEYKNYDLTKEQWAMEFGKRLDTLLDRCDKNQGWLSEQLEVSQQLVSRYIRGETIPSAYIMNKIIDVLGCKADDLIFVPLALKNIYSN